MRSAALVFVLTFFVSFNLLGQHHSEGGSVSANSSSSSIGSYSSSTNSSSHASSSGGGGGGSSSHSSGPGGGSSHSSYSSSSSSHVGAISPSSQSPQTGSTRNTAFVGGISGAKTTGSAISHAALPKENFGLLGSGQDWMQQAILLHHVDGDFNKALQRGEFDSELHEIGIESSRKAYLARLTALGQSDPSIQEKKPNWLARAFVSPRPGPIGPPRPCKGKNCKPGPVPPPGPKPVRSPFVNTAFCYGYLERCNRSGICYAYLRPIANSQCDEIRRQLNERESEAKELQVQQEAACSGSSQTAECISASANFQQAEADVAQLRAQYRVCVAGTDLAKRKSRAGSAPVPLTFDVIDQ